jgi:hypothetical protein
LFLLAIQFDTPCPVKNVGQAQIIERIQNMYLPGGFASFAAFAFFFFARMLKNSIRPNF